MTLSRSSLIRSAPTPDLERVSRYGVQAVVLHYDVLLFVAQHYGLNAHSLLQEGDHAV